MFLGPLIRNASVREGVRGVRILVLKINDYLESSLVLKINDYLEIAPKRCESVGQGTRRLAMATRNYVLLVCPLSPRYLPLWARVCARSLSPAPSTHEARRVYRFWGILGRLDLRRSPVLGTRSSEPMHTIRANLYWEFQFVLGYIAVPRSRIRPGNPLRVGRG